MQSRCNSGVGFLIFTDDRIIKDYKYFGMDYFQQQVRSEISLKSIERL